jgi:hypothetical protein
MGIMERMPFAIRQSPTPNHHKKLGLECSMQLRRALVNISLTAPIAPTHLAHDMVFSLLLPKRILPREASRLVEAIGDEGIEVCLPRHALTSLSKNAQPLEKS